MQDTQEELESKVRELQKEVKQLRAQLKEKRFGLTWIDVPEAFEKESENKIPVLEEVPELAIHNDDGKPTHILIEGDNYHALTCLNYTHRGKIDVIYIDPPYNKGGDFIYRDSRFLKEYPDGTPVPKNHPLRHSVWLSFMKKRLEYAKELLSEKGVIFISIDDDEQAHLKLLCDEVLKGLFFLATIPWRKRTAKADVPHGLSQDYEWILCYCGEKFRAGIEKETRKYYTTQDFPDRPWRIHDMTKQTTAEERPMSFFTIVNPKTGEKYPASKLRTWAITSDTLPYYEEQNRIVYPGDYDFLNIKRPVLRYWKEDDEKKAGDLYGMVTTSTDLPKEVGMTQDGTKDITDIFREKAFGFPKPVSLIKHIIGIATPRAKEITVLDFFAGSGTTLHAVMQLNEGDEGRRQCILCQINEANICRDVTYERNRRVMQGYQDSKGNEVGGLGNSLKYYRTAFVGKNQPKAATDDDKLALARKAGCLLGLAENTLYERLATEYYQLYTDEQGRWTCIYFQEDYSHFEEFRQRVVALEGGQKNVYVFSWTDGVEFAAEFEFENNVSVKSIPQPILDIYKSLNA